MNKNEIFIQADSANAEGRVVFRLARDEEALTLLDTVDYHALTATWFFPVTYEEINKKALGYEHPIRFCGKTLRHAGHLMASKKRASITVNTEARKNNIPIKISEQQADIALQIFHRKQPNIRQVFHYEVIEALKKTRILIAPTPYGMNLNGHDGGRRTFYERMGDELFRQGMSYLPQRAVTDNTKSAGLRIRKRIKGIKIVMESHDALLFCVNEKDIDDFIPIIQEEFERPIDFERCSLPRESLIIPCEIEVGYNYHHLKKFGKK